MLVVPLITVLNHAQVASVMAEVETDKGLVGSSVLLQTVDTLVF